MKTEPRGHHWHHVPVPSSPTTTFPGAGTIGFTNVQPSSSLGSSSVPPLTLLNVTVAGIAPAPR